MTCPLNSHIGNVRIGLIFKVYFSCVRLSSLYTNCTRNTDRKTFIYARFADLASIEANKLSLNHQPDFTAAMRFLHANLLVDSLTKFGNVRNYADNAIAVCHIRECSDG